MRVLSFRILFAYILLFAMLASAGAQDAAKSAGVFETPLTLENLDAAAFAAWVDGAEKPMEKPSAGHLDEDHCSWISVRRLVWRFESVRHPAHADRLEGSADGRHRACSRKRAGQRAQGRCSLSWQHGR